MSTEVTAPVASAASLRSRFQTGIACIAQLAVGTTDPHRAGRILGMLTAFSASIAGVVALALSAVSGWLASFVLKAPGLGSALAMGSGVLGRSAGSASSRWLPVPTWHPADVGGSRRRDARGRNPRGQRPPGFIGLLVPKLGGVLLMGLVADGGCRARQEIGSLPARSQPEPSSPPSVRLTFGDRLAGEELFVVKSQNP
jgi:hypothetical protein